MTSEHALAKALELAAQGIPVLPCRADKKPACEHGFKQATTDADELRGMWWPSGVLVGVPTGAASGLFVLDIDGTRHPEASDWLELHASCLPETRRHQTQSGGLHFLFQYREGLRNTQSKLAHGVDTRGEGGYVIWWSAHVEGDHHLIDPAPMPDWLYAAAAPDPEPVVQRREAISFNHVPDRLRGILTKVRRAREGERNAVTFWAACRVAEMTAEGRLSESDALSARKALEHVATNTGLSTLEVRRTIKSAMGQ